MATETDKNGKFGNVKLGKYSTIAHLGKLNDALPNSRGLVIVMFEEFEGKTRVHALSHGHIELLDWKQIIDFAVVRIMQQTPVAIVGIPLEDIEHGQVIS